ncbi:Uncharacterized protein DAT39_002900 [Clarias magur]|uniref:Uncharacterized protein n=1 Tax=Clarias magur TaxID=1594786 RepID=A0A8J4UTV7_CLAMG|nr:Uncharacterized protein DAT39_002900 [Clarias magur]
MPVIQLTNTWDLTYSSLFGILWEDILMTSDSGQCCASGAVPNGLLFRLSTSSPVARHTV